jgi:DNA polymerase-4
MNGADERPATRERVILHADMDAFFASIEQRDRPELRGKPVIVGAAARRGVVAAASYEARVYGVRSAMPGFRARELCPDAVFLPSDMKKYAAVSAQIHRVFEELTPVIEPIALDEAFLDVTASVHLFGTPEALGQHLRQRVRAETQLAVSCGIARSKLVAKIACSLGKPDGLLRVHPHEERALLDPLPIRRLWGIGPVTEQALLAAGFATFADLARAELRDLRRAIGDRAEELQKRARGEDDRPVEANRDAKSYGEESTFERDVRDREAITAAITGHSEAVARRLRHDHLAGRTVTLKVKLGHARSTRSASRVPTGDAEPDYPLLTRSKTLAHATDDAAVIRKTAIALWDAAHVRDAIRLLGVSLSSLEASGQQLSLFGEQKDEKHGKLGAAMDAITARFGSGVIGRGVHAPDKVTHSMRKKRGEE